MRVSELNALWLAQKRIVLALGADRGAMAVAGVNDDIVRENKQLLVDRAHDLRERAAGEVGSADAALEQRVAGDQAALLSVTTVVGRAGALHDQTDAPGRVAGRVQNASGKATPTQRVPFFHKIANLNCLGRRDAEPLRLHIEAAVEAEIGVVDQDRSAGRAMQRSQAADVVDVRVCADDRANLQFVVADDFEDAIDLVARVDDDGFARLWVAKDRAIALQHADGNDFVNEFF